MKLIKQIVNMIKRAITFKKNPIGFYCKTALILSMQVNSCLATSRALDPNTFSHLEILHNDNKVYNPHIVNSGEEDDYKASKINSNNNSNTNKMLKEFKKMLQILEKPTCTFTISDVLKSSKVQSSVLKRTIAIKKEMIAIEEGILARNKEIVIGWKKLASAWKEEEVEEKEMIIEVKNLIAIEQGTLEDTPGINSLYGTFILNHFVSLTKKTHDTSPEVIKEIHKLEEDNIAAVNKVISLSEELKNLTSSLKDL